MTSWLFPPCSFLGSQFGLTFRFALLPSYPHASAQFVFPYCFSGPRTQARMDFSPNLPDTPKTPRRLDPPLYIAPPMVFSARPWPNALLHNEMCRLNNTPCLCQSLVNNRLLTLDQTPCRTAPNLPLSAVTISPRHP
ncbi:hypothetical protein F5882DRAFT_394588 [Hyaloscypha sp. PMI_1271]|nr:hypothetical protein F5882DRAFT_394588 [Hyaloscypha sp. PMI_1271]